MDATGVAGSALTQLLLGQLLQPYNRSTDRYLGHMEGTVA